jgi:pSer/pThr/pTyr-binding forkhead associated (FHA) protein
MADAKQASLTVLGGPSDLAGAQIPLPVDGVVTLGSAADCTFPLTAPSVSPLHARLVLEGGRATVHSIGSEQPLYINDNPLGGESAALRNGDILWLGTPGEEDVVMLQCILAPLPEAPRAPAPAAPTPEVETQALWSMEGAEAPPEAPPVAPPETPAVEPPAAPPAGGWRDGRPRAHRHLVRSIVRGSGPRGPTG